MKKFFHPVFVTIIVAITLAFIFTLGAHAQSNVRLEGKTFVVDSVSKGQETKTEYTYQDKNGKLYEVYLSKNGKAFIYAVSKNTGKVYKRYLPKITEMLNEKRK